MEHKTFLAAAQAMAMHHAEHEQCVQTFLGYSFFDADAAQAADRFLRQKFGEWVTTTIHEVPVQKVDAILQLNDLAAEHPFASQRLTINGKPSLMYRARANETVNFVTDTFDDFLQRPPCFRDKLPVHKPVL